MMSSQLALTVLLVWLGAALATPASPPAGKPEGQPEKQVFKQYLTNLLGYDGKNGYADKPAIRLSGIVEKTYQEELIAVAQPGYSVFFALTPGRYTKLFLTSDDQTEFNADFSEVVQEISELADLSAEKQYNGKQVESYVEAIVFNVKTWTGTELTRYTSNFLVGDQKPLGKITANKVR